MSATADVEETAKRSMAPRPRAVQDPKAIGRIVARFAGEDQNSIKYGGTYFAKMQTNLLMDSKMMWQVVVN